MQRAAVDLQESPVLADAFSLGEAFFLQAVCPYAAT